MEPIQERYSEPAVDHSALVGEAERAARRARLVFAKWSSKALGSARARSGPGAEAAQSLAEAVIRAPTAAAGSGEAGAGAGAGEPPDGARRRRRGGPRGPGPPSLKAVWSSNRVHPEA